MRPLASLFVAIAALTMLSASSSRAEELKVGVVDLQRALNEVAEGASAKAALKKEFDEKQKQLDSKQTELKAMKDELDARGSMMKPEVKQAKVEELQKKLIETQQLYAQLQQDLSKREGEATSEIFKKMGVILQAMGEEQTFTMIVEKSNVLYLKSSLDLTNELIRRYDSAYGKKATKK